MDIKELFESFKSKKILVIGDVMIDSYLNGKVERISPEAPVPIVSLKQMEDRLGGAANVALNLQSLGAEPILCATIGDDRGADLFLELLDKNNLTNRGIIRDSNRKTTVKTRVIGNNQHILRVDNEEVKDLNEDQVNSLLTKVEQIVADGIDAIILEDYNKGLLTKEVIQKVIELANRTDVVTTVDPKKDNFFEYKNVTLFKPNLKELKEGLNVEFNFDDDKNAFEDAIQQMEDILNNKLSFVTLSEHGVFIKENLSKNYIPAHIRNIADVSGAGDTVISVATLCLVGGCSAKDVAYIANLAGGLVCEESGVVPIDKKVLMEELENLPVWH